MVHASKLKKRASKRHDLESQGRIGKPKVKIKDPEENKWLIVDKTKTQHDDEPEKLMLILKIARNFFVALFLGEKVEKHQSTFFSIF